MLTGWRQRLVEVESIVSLLMACAGGFLPPILFGFFVLLDGVLRGKPSLCIVGGSLTAVTAASAIWVARMARAALGQSCPRLAWLLAETSPAVSRPASPLEPGAPLAVVMAYRLPRIPWLLRPVVGLWWAAQFAGVAALGILVNEAMGVALKHAPLHQQVLLPLSMHLILLFAANLYLLLAVAVFFRNPAVHARVWSWRFVIDLTLSLAACGLTMRW